MQGAPPSLTSRVEISVSCRNLQDRDISSKSDPMVVLSQKFGSSPQYVEMMRSDVIKDSLNPVFADKFEMDYRFEESQKLLFEVYDVDSRSAQLSQHDFLGRVQCTLGELVSRGQHEMKLQGVRGHGTITFACSELVACKEMLRLQLMAEHLDKKDFLGKSDPYYEIFRANRADARAPSDFTLVHRSEVIKNNLNPVWQPLTLRLTKLCLGDKTRPLRIDCYDYDNDGSHDLIGSLFTSTDQLVAAGSNPSQNNMPLINPKKKQKKRDYKNSGVLRVKTAVIETWDSFVDYISGGTDLNFSVAVDFTGSNGNPHHTNSLHYIDRSPYPRLNQYELAIISVGEIIQDYDRDQQYPALGFGARVPPERQLSHCFPLSFTPHNPFCAGVSGLLSAYRNAITAVELYGPTNFEPVIRHVMQFAAQNQDGRNYFVLLIITDGVITDLDRTIRAIIEASRLPMSIIIVGVGNDEFETMDILDADGQRLRQGNAVAERDIVQFVPLRRFASSSHQPASQAALAQAVLAELPDQMVLWMRSRGIRPLKRREPPQGLAGYPSGPPQEPGGYPSGPPQGPGGYPSGPPQGPGGYPSGPPQGPGGYPSGPPQGPGGYPSGPPQGPGGYPSGPPQGPGGYPSGPPQGPGGYASGPPPGPQEPTAYEFSPIQIPDNLGSCHRTNKRVL